MVLDYEQRQLQVFREVHTLDKNDWGRQSTLPYKIINRSLWYRNCSIPNASSLSRVQYSECVKVLMIPSILDFILITYINFSNLFSIYINYSLLFLIL